MDPKILFLRYAFACVTDLFREEKIDQDDFDTLGSLVDREKAIPDVSLLKRCFPIACINLYSLAKSKGRRPWTGQNVESFWRRHHGQHRTPVEIHEVELSRADGFVKVKSESTKFFYNRYNLDLKPGDRVYTHVSLIVEKI
jgi:hypothetical protein